MKKKIDLSTVLILDLVVGVLIILAALVWSGIEVVPKIDRRYVLTTLVDYPENLHEFGRVLLVEEKIVRKVLSHSAKIYANLSGLPGVTMVIDVTDIEIPDLQNVHIFVRPKTVCLGPITPACLVRMRHGETVVLLGSEEVGYTKCCSFEIPELSSIILEVSNVDVYSVMSLTRTVVMIGVAMLVAFGIGGLAYIMLYKKGSQH